MTEYIVTLLPGSGIGSTILGILGALFYLKNNNIKSILNINQYYASSPVKCLIDCFLDKELIKIVNFISINRPYKNADKYKELFFVKETEDIYHRITNPEYFKDILPLFNNIFILKHIESINQNELEKYEICINIRRGDKITLESFQPVAQIESYIEKIEQLNLENPKIIHTSDDYGTFLEIIQLRPKWDIITLNSPDEQGYFLSELNTSPFIKIYNHVEKFLKQLHIMKGSKYFIGTNSTSVAFLVKLLRNVIEDESNIYI